jgi:hypothetical protein
VARYHDDPIEIAPSSPGKFSGVIKIAFLFIVGTLFIQNTLAANINLGASAPIEFGQGISRTIACDNDGITLRPESSFANTSGGGSFKVGSIVFSNVDSGALGCNGKSFTIKAFGNTSSIPINLVGSVSSILVTVSSSTPYFSIPSTTGVTLTNLSSTGFTITLDQAATPAATGDVFRITVESSEATAQVVPATYVVGNTGPGGGIIFYVSSAGFDCGSSFTSTGSPTGGKCNYLEAAPSLWAGGAADPKRLWAVSAKQSTGLPEITDDFPANNNSSAIGLGYKNSLAIVAQGNDNTTAAFVARGYNGGSKSDWYLPTTAELNLLCQWARGVAPSVTTVCTGGSINSATYGASSAGFVADNYWSSSEGSNAGAWLQTFLNGGQFNYGWKGGSQYVRPIRAF